MSLPGSHHQLVCYGEILWDILPSGPMPGGAPMNVAYHLHKLGKNPALITRIGLDDYGKELINRLSAKGVSTEYFQVDYHHPTGIVHAKPNEHNEVAYDIVYPSAWDFISWDKSFEELVQKADHFIFGSLSCRSYTSRNTLFHLLDAARNKILDINLRPPHFDRNIVEQLLGSADILKLNLSELELITGWISDFDSINDRIRMVQDRFHINTIIVTMGGDGAILNLNGHIYRHNGYRVQVADTVGSGDSFLAATISKLIDGGSPEEILDYACATGALIASYAGACPDYDTGEILELTKRKQADMI